MSMGYKEKEIVGAAKRWQHAPLWTPGDSELTRQTNGKRNEQRFLKSERRNIISGEMVLSGWKRGLEDLHWRWSHMRWLGGHCFINQSMSCAGGYRIRQFKADKRRSCGDTKTR